MYKYVVRAGRYGGEVAIGTVNADFVRYWKERVEEDGDGDLVEVLCDWDVNWETSDSPEPIEGYNPGGWYEIDDLEHFNSCYHDSDVYVQRVGDDGEDIGEPEIFSLNDAAHVYSRECYAGSEEPSEEELENGDVVPVLMFHSAEKGQFWQVDLELNEPFDISKFQVGFVETDVATMPEQVWYDKTHCELNYDWCDTNGKGYYAYVGWMVKKWHDAPQDYFNYHNTDKKTKVVEECFEYLDEE